MKKSYVKYEEMLSLEVINQNYYDICRNTKHKNKLIKYDMFKMLNMHSLFIELKEKRYKHTKFNIFIIREPKYRIVMSENIKDKIVNHMVSNVFLKPYIYPKLIEENVATRIGKGTDAAIKLCKKYFLRMMNKYEEFYILKFDIKKYFYNIDHDILKKLLREIYVDDDVYNILCQIIGATNASYINKEIDRVINIEREKLKRINKNEAINRNQELDKIPHYSENKGLGIGSLTSQIFAIFYLTPLDHFIKEELHVKEYIRFMDDGIIFSNDLEKLQKFKLIIEEYLKKLKLTLNDKTLIFSSKQGFEFVGYKFRNNNGKMLVKIKNQTKRRMYKKFKVLKKHDEEKLIRVKASYKGLVQYCTVKGLYIKNFTNNK